MFFIIVFLFYNTLFNVTVVAGVHVLSVQLEPKLFGDQQYYDVFGSCSVANRKIWLHKIWLHNDQLLQNQQQQNAYDLITLSLTDAIGPPFQPIKCQINVSIKRSGSNLATWKTPYATEIEMDNPHKVVHLKFANHFKLVISPEFSEHSKMLYGVSVYCAGSKDDREFRANTKFDAMVVLNFVQEKCEQYDVTVWPLHINEHRRTLSKKPVVLVENGVTIANGQTHQIYFKNCFTLRINPPLLANREDHFYHAIVKCHPGNVTGQEYGVLMQDSEQVVLNEPNCAAYDISVAKLVWPKAANTSGEKLFVYHNEESQFGVTIPNGHTHLFNYVDRMAQQSVESSSSIDSLSASANIKELLKRLFTELASLKREVAQIKEFAEQMRERIEKGLMQINDALTKKFASK